MTTKKKISLAMGLLLASTALQAEEVVNRGIDVSVVTGGVAVPIGTTLNGAERNVMFGDRSYQIPENVEVGSYYATWGIYDGRKYWPADVPVERLSEVYIAFAAICGSNPGANNGGKSLEKFYADSHDNTDVGSYYLPEIKSLDQGEVSFIDDPWGMFDMKDTSAEATAADTQIKQIIDWKNRNADLDVIMSVGGWSYSRPFFEMISTPENRTKFLNSLGMWLKTPVFGFIDEIDFDFEYPGGEGYNQDVGDATVDGANYNALILEARAMIDRINDETGRDLQLTMAIGIGPSKLDNWAQSARISEIMPVVDRMGLMTYDFSGSQGTETWFNSALGRPEGSGQPASVITAIEQLKSQHGITEQDFSKISIGVAFYGRGQANVTHATPENLPGSPASGGTEGGTVEPAVFSYFDLRDNFIGPDGRGINGWKVYNYPEYAASLLYNQDTGEAISFTVPEDMQAIANYVKENGFKGMFSWQIDDDNGELLETIHQTLGHPQATPRVADRPYIYAPDCVTMAPTHIAPGLVFSDAGNVYVGSGWPAACPNQGASWEQNSWTLIGSTDEFTVLGAWETNDDGGTGDGGAGDGGTGDSNAWVPGQVYATAGAEVSHNGRTWTNSWWTNGEPGIDPAWTITSAINNGDAWIPGHAYETAGAEVSHNGKLYRNQWWTNGEPGIDAAWVEISGTSDAPETPVDTPDEGDESPELPSDGDLWRSDYTYATAGKIVVHPSGGPSWFNTGYTLGDTPGSSVEWQPQTITDGDPWNSLVLYDAATRNEGSRQYVVAHNGELWVNQYYTLGDVPGSSPAWARQYTHANGDLWRADYVYATAGKIVVYPSGGSSWYNSGYSLGDQPDQTVVWQPVTITDGDPWDPLVIYDASTRNEGNRQYVVTHSGERWVNQYYSLGDQPGTSTAWARDYTFTAGDAWRSDYVYSQPNMVVAYPNAGGKLWFNTAYSLGDTPTVSTVWQPVTLTDGDPWDPLVIYSASARSETRSYYEVLHNGKLWRNSTYSLNEEPGKSAAWQPSTLVDNDPWDANIIYDGPTRGEGNRTYIVTHAGQIWSNAYYSLGDEPGSSSAWVPVVTHSDGDIWSATYIYATAGAIVRYPANGALWYNLYYSANEQPGTTQTWQPVSIVDEDPWQANVIYDATTRGEGSRFYIVSHNGSLWQNTTYSVGETPSATAVTWAPVAPAGDGIPLWNSATVYSVAGTIVKDANGRKWYNEYWTQNDVPGASNVWQPVTITDRDPWSRYIFYSASRRNEGTRKYLVSYNGAIWQNQWDTQGETPGVSAVWAPGP